MPTRRKTDQKSASAPGGEGGLHIERYYNSRNFALYDGQDLLAVTVYRKGAEAIKTRLEADAQTIADQQRQIDALKALAPQFQARATPPANSQPWRPPLQLPLLAAEDLADYRIS